MKKTIFIFITLFLCIACGNNSSKHQEQTISEDSIASLLFNKYNEFTFCASNKDIISLDDSLIISYVKIIEPQVANSLKNNLDDPNSYENIYTYIGTDGTDWIVYDKFRSKVGGNLKIQYYKYDTSLSGNHEYFCTDKDYPDNWRNLVSSIDNTPAPYPSELDNKIFNHSISEISLTSFDANKKCISVGDKAFIKSEGKITKEIFK